MAGRSLFGVWEGWVSVRGGTLVYVCQQAVNFFSHLWGSSESGSCSFNGSEASPELKCFSSLLRWEEFVAMHLDFFRTRPAYPVSTSGRRLSTIPFIILNTRCISFAVFRKIKAIFKKF